MTKTRAGGHPRLRRQHRQPRARLARVPQLTPTAAGAISAAECGTYWKQAWKALCEVGAEQERYRRDADPVGIYLRALRALVTSTASTSPTLTGTANRLTANAGDGSTTASTISASRFTGQRQPGAELLGWVDGSDVYLQPDSAFKAARQHAEAAGQPLNLSTRMLHKHLHERNLLAGNDPRHYTVRRRLDGTQQTVLWLTVNNFESDGTTP